MMHHVVDGYVIEFPGSATAASPGTASWTLSQTFGDSLKFGALDMTPTKHVIMMWIASALLLLVVLLGRPQAQRWCRAALYNFVEVLVAFVRNELAVPNIGKEHADRFLPYLLTAFFFILFVNLLRAAPLSAAPPPPTST